MRKRYIQSSERAGNASDSDWLNMEQLAEVELTSEDAAHRIEAALSPDSGVGWQAAVPGEQLIRFRFRQPQRIRRIFLEFVENSLERTQEFCLRWAADGDSSLTEIVRQQWNFSPHGSTREIEDFQVDLAGVRIIELNIIPDTHGCETRAGLANFRVA